MQEVLGCHVDAALLAQWDVLFVPSPAPFFLHHALPLPANITVIERKAFSRQDFALAYHDSYRTYAVTAAAQQIAFLDGAAFNALPHATQQALLADQVRLNRGHVYAWDDAQKYCQAGEQAHILSRCVDVDGTRYLVLDPFVWEGLHPADRQQWVIDYISADGSPCLASTLTGAQWGAMLYPSIRHLAGTFEPQSGANCFATTLAAITASLDQAMTIAREWVQVDQFLAGLAERGYQHDPHRTAQADDLHDAVLAWYEQDNLQHACYLIQPDLVLNKNSQCWYSPRQILTLAQLLEDWQDQPMQIRVYTRQP